MRSLFGRLGAPVNQPPVPYTQRSTRSGLAGLFGGGTSTTKTAALNAYRGVGTLFGIVNRTSNATSQVDWHLYRKAKSGKKEDRVEVTSHAALDLWNRPNPFMPRQEFVETSQQHVDLAGESPWVVAYDQRARNLPLELWPVRPDRMEPDPHPDKFLTGWKYTDPDGGEIPLGLKEVIHLRMPDPIDPFRGFGPVQSILVDLDSSRYTSEWNRNFFRNSAEPGGILEVDKRLSDEEFDEMTTRWNEQHRGVANAHRVAVIEQGKWINRTFTMRDMQFAELRGVARDTIMEAFGFPKPLLGIVEDVNRANADAGEYVFAKWLVVPRLERIKGALNNDLLPLYGDTARDLEFDYDSPVPDDDDAENAARESKTNAFKILVDAGVEPDDAAEIVGLPRMRMRTAPAPAPAPAGKAADTSADAQWQSIVARLVRNADDPPDDDPPEVDLSATQAAFTAALDLLLLQWVGIVADWITELIQQIVDIFRSGGDRTQLADIEVATAPAVDALQDAMTDLGETAANLVVDEAAEQDVNLDPVWPARADYAEDARLTVDLLASGIATSAAREAQRVAGPDPDADQVGEAVRTHLESLTDAEPRRALGGALHSAVNHSRFATFAAGPVGALYASEVMDSATCGPCKAIDGRWICNTDDLAPLYALYPLAGYVDCKGRERCRGTVVGAWRPGTGEA
ncbi:phage portal protein [Actinosynnema sp. NPDC023587]|uniref:phage portal protein n=1 Tax=Actinosynnema sp. NPDC023587 TaxID=3154695 RepID=UPI0034064DD0